jgi:putative PIN family toxin of toxin-antitoxin system
VRVFLDTNVLVSAFATRGLCSDLLEVVLLDHELITGTAVLRELERVLSRKIKLPKSRVSEVIDYVVSEAALVVADATPADVAADEADSKVLGEALAASAGVFVTGDAELLDLRAVGTLRIVSPRQFWQMLRAG